MSGIGTSDIYRDVCLNVKAESKVVVLVKELKSIATVQK